MTTPERIIPYGFCHCGCGNKTKLARQTNHSCGWIKDRPLLFVHGHNWRGLKRSEQSIAQCSEAKLRHGHSRKLCRSSTYITWAGMIARCFDANCPAFRDYGGRGIIVCDRWRDFVNFLADMGERPSGTSIDRFPDNNGNYEPGNCRWANWIEQQNNRRSNHVIEWRGKSYTVSNLAREVGLGIKLISGRLRQGWTVDRAACTPRLNRGRHALRER